MHRRPVTDRLPRLLLVGASVLGLVAAAFAVALVSGWGSNGPLRDRENGASSRPTQAAAAVNPEPGQPLAGTDQRAALSPPGDQPAPSTGAASPVGTAGMLVGIDPETRRPGPPSRAFRTKVAGMAPSLDRSVDGLTVVSRPDGSKHVDLQGRFQEYTVVRLTPDGRKVEDCVDGPDVGAALRADAPPAPALEEK